MLAVATDSKSKEESQNIKSGKKVTVSKKEGSPIITLCLASIGMDSVLCELCYKGTLLQRNYRKFGSHLSFKGTARPPDKIE